MKFKDAKYIFNLFGLILKCTLVSVLIHRTLYTSILNRLINQLPKGPKTHLFPFKTKSGYKEFIRPKCILDAYSYLICVYQPKLDRFYFKM